MEAELPGVKQWYYYVKQLWFKRVRLGEWFVEGNNYESVEDSLPDPQDFVIDRDMVRYPKIYSKLNYCVGYNP